MRFGFTAEFRNPLSSGKTSATLYAETGVRGEPRSSTITAE